MYINSTINVLVYVPLIISVSFIKVFIHELGHVCKIHRYTKEYGNKYKTYFCIFVGFMCNGKTYSTFYEYLQDDKEKKSIQDIIRDIA